MEIGCIVLLFPPDDVDVYRSAVERDSAADGALSAWMQSVRRMHMMSESSGRLYLYHLTSYLEEL